MNALTASESLGHFLPELVLVATVIIVFLVDLVVAHSPQREIPAAVISAVGLAIAVVLAAGQWSDGLTSLFSGMVVVDPFAVFFKVLILLATLAGLVFLFRSRELVRDAIGETYALLLVMVLSCILLASSSNLLMMYLALEGVSLASYVLAGFSRHNRKASEAALKYVIYGGVASGVMLFGLSYLYGLTGTLDLFTLRERLATIDLSPNVSQLNLVMVVAVVFVMAGVAYKVAAAPFHMWCPDVYEGSPTPIAAIFSVVPKAAGVALMIRFFYVGFVEAGADGEYLHLTHIPWIPLFGVVAAATMTIGNLGALWQKNIKRLLAYSSIAHVGYILMGFVVLGRNGLSAMLFYMAVYAIMNMGAFFCVVVARNATGLEDKEGVRGLGYREPIVALCMTVFLISLTGLPPMAGFIGKYFLFAAVLEQRGLWLDVLVAIAALNSAISLFYYAGVFRSMYLDKPVDRRPVRVPLGHSFALAILAVATLVLGFISMFITPLKDASQEALVFKGQAAPSAQIASGEPPAPPKLKIQ